MALGDNIQKYRLICNLSQDALAKRLEVKRSVVSLWEKNVAEPTMEELRKLRDILGVTADQLLGEAEPENMPLNQESMTSVCAGFAYAMGVEPPKYAAPPSETVTSYVDEMFGGEKADRLIIFNPDAFAQWLYEKYRHHTNMLRAHRDLEVPIATVMPSVTPVNFGTMYTGAEPAVHGIEQYEKKLITIDSLYDALARAGKKVALVACKGWSMGTILLERDIDYYLIEGAGLENGGASRVQAKAVELILKDEYDVVIVYNGFYDSAMHRFGPESVEALAELRSNCYAFAEISELVAEHYGNHNTLVCFASDHGCHEIDGGLGSHGLDMPEDRNVMHLYKAYPGKK